MKALFPLNITMVHEILNSHLQKVLQVSLLGYRPEYMSLNKGTDALKKPSGFGM